MSSTPFSSSKETQDLLLSAYAEVSAGASLQNDALYHRLEQLADLPDEAFRAKAPIGGAQEHHSPLKRRVRWHQQTLKAMGLIERDEAAGRGSWRITLKGRKTLTPAQGTSVLLGYSTDLGVALWAASSSVFARIDEPITLCLTSPPYPLAVPRAYGNPTVAQYTDFVCEILEPIVRHLVPGGSVCLNISNDIFETGLPSRSTYRERLVIALEDRLGLHKMDEFPWINPSKPPGPLRWASISRQQLNMTWEPVYWLTNDPKLCKSDNRRVLQQHTQKHLELLRQGGENRTCTSGDGAYRIRPGSFSGLTEGRIPRNVLTYSHAEPEKARMRRMAREQGLPVHGAMMPRALARFLIQFLTMPGDLVVDPCGGWGTTGAAAEELGRRWLLTEIMGEYVLGGANGFRDRPGFEEFGAAGGA